MVCMHSPGIPWRKVIHDGSSMISRSKSYQQNFKSGLTHDNESINNKVREACLWLKDPHRPSSSGGTVYKQLQWNPRPSTIKTNSGRVLCVTLLHVVCRSMSISIRTLGGGLRRDDSKSGSTAHLEQNQTTGLGCKAPAEHWLPGHSQDAAHEVLIRIVAGQHADKTNPNMTVFGVGS